MVKLTVHGATVTNATEFTGWGDAVDAGTITLEPGLWSLSNFGQVLVATIANGKTFTWNSGMQQDYLQSFYYYTDFQTTITQQQQE